MPVLRASLLAACVVATLAACGTKGPLTLPAKTPASAPASPPLIDHSSNTGGAGR